MRQLACHPLSPRAASSRRLHHTSHPPHVHPSSPPTPLSFFFFFSKSDPNAALPPSTTRHPRTAPLRAPCVCRADKLRCSAHPPTHRRESSDGRIGARPFVSRCPPPFWLCFARASPVELARRSERSCVFVEAFALVRRRVPASRHRPSETTYLLDLPIYPTTDRPAVGTGSFLPRPPPAVPCSSACIY